MIICTILVILMAFACLSNFFQKMPEPVCVPKDTGHSMIMEKLPMDKDDPDTVCNDYACRDHLNSYDKLLYMQCLPKVQVAVGIENIQKKIAVVS